MPAIHHDFHTRQTGAGRNRAFAEFNITTGGIHDALSLAESIRLDGFQRPLQQIFDAFLGFVGQLLSVAGKEFDAVIIVGIMRSADHDAGAGMQGARQIGDARGRHGT